MYSIFDINQIDIETINNCNASCPLCLRTKGMKTNDILNWDAVIKSIPIDVWKQIKDFNFNGTTGDNLMHPKIKEIIQWIISNTSGNVNLHTNGSVRSAAWWEEFGKMLKGTPHKVVFGIDGLEDTHSIYRIGTDYNKIIENATAFIKGGGNAEWQFILFDHNKHQVDTAKELANSLGFNQFFTLYQDRFNINGEVNPGNSNKLEQTIKKINISEIRSDTIVRTTTAQDISKKLNQKIDCRSKRVGWLSIYADGTVWPCCWLMGWHKASGQGVRYASVNYHFKKYLNLDFSEINLYNHSIEKILNSNFYKTKLEESFNKIANPVCIQQCSK